MDDKGILNQTMNIGDKVEVISGYLKGKNGTITEFRGSQNICETINNQRVILNVPMVLFTVESKDSPTGKITQCSYEISISLLRKTN